MKGCSTSCWSHLLPAYTGLWAPSLADLAECLWNLQSLMRLVTYSGHSVPRVFQKNVLSVLVVAVQSSGILSMKPGNLMAWGQMYLIESSGHGGTTNLRTCWFVKASLASSKMSCMKKTAVPLKLGRWICYKGKIQELNTMAKPRNLPRHWPCKSKGPFCFWIVSWFGTGASVARLSTQGNRLCVEASVKSNKSNILD